MQKTVLLWCLRVSAKLIRCINFQCYEHNRSKLNLSPVYWSGVKESHDGYMRQNHHQTKMALRSKTSPFFKLYSLFYPQDMKWLIHLSETGEHKRFPFLFSLRTVEGARLLNSPRALPSHFSVLLCSPSRCTWPWTECCFRYLLLYRSSSFWF